MKIRFVLVVYILFFNLIPGFAQTDKHVFKDIVLEQPLPQIFRAGEIYFLKGAVPGAATDVPVTADVLLLDSDFQSVQTVISKKGRFSLGLHFEHPGLYNLSIKINYKAAGSIMLNAVNPIKIEQMPLLPIENYRTFMEDFKPKLTWQTKNEIVQFQIRQDHSDTLFTLTNNPVEFDFQGDNLSKFHEGEAALRIRGARSIDGTWFTMASGWSDWQEKKRILVENISPKINSLATFRTPYSCAGDVNSKIEFELQIKTTYYPDAFIARPDGRVDVIRLQADKKLTEFSIGGEPKRLYPAGTCSFEYLPVIAGIYLIEINDAYGNALINIPFYCGNVLPLLPGKTFAMPSQPEDFDLQSERINMLDEINMIRQKLGFHRLIPDENLNRLAQYYSDRMANEKFTAHVAPSDNEALDMRRKKFRIVAQVMENVAQAPSIGETFHNLVRSPAHYAAMIDSAMTRAGIGISMDDAKSFYIAQHFSGESLSPGELEVFLAKLFIKMQSAREQLTRLEAPGEISYIMKISYTGSTLDRIENMVLNEKSNLTWNSELIGQIYFENFSQTYEGFKLDVKYYPFAPDREKK